MAGFALPRNARLSRRCEFDAVRGRGKAWHGNLMVLSGLRGELAQAARFGVITSRKVGCAAERNRARRRLREIFRLHRGLLPAGLWMVVVLRRSAAGATFTALAAEWRALCGRAGYLKA